ncbi:hypothetical protein [Pleionea sp. CnH1-48]|uniref:hypothetical protein n=1 Tax=Pleionea sp. CnH1-48 TaxID=2954494 RepID=UPI002097B638|nr:hypothetical protein [Pleionea sp. CnH1-48]MCO7224553.1 hypothetical protein [Pleionea sp. CnH1-48]
MKFLAGVLLLVGSLSSSAAVINQMSTGSFGGYSQTYGQHNRTLMVLGQADDYMLDDGSSWSSGAGWHPTQYADVESIFIEDNIINYVLDMNVGSVLFQNTDYDSGQHSAQGVLTTVDQLILQAELGSTTATISGYAQIDSNDATWYGEPRFNYYAADVGELVAFSVTYNLLNGFTWNESIFNDQFRYNINGMVDFTDTLSVSEPAGLLLFLSAAVGWLYRRRVTMA